MQSTTRQEICDEVAALLPALHRFARTFTSGCDVDDLVQETVTRAISYVDQFEPGTRLRSWLFTIMRNTFYNQAKVANKHMKIRQKGVVIWETSEPMSQEWSLRLKDVERAVDALAPEFRDALRRSVSGEGYRAIAEHSNCAVGTVKSRVSRARSLIMNRTGEDQHIS
jgi:RNA polymerase sigma-70 factor (ECF subfamily)